MTLVYKLVLRFIWKTSQDLDGTLTHNHHNSGVTAWSTNWAIN